MSNVKTITRAQAIESALALVKESAAFDDSWNEVAEVLQKMHDQLVKPRAKAVSKARLLNESLALKVKNLLPEDGLTSKGIVGLGIPEIATTQKAVAVMRVAEEIGIVERVKDGKTITYKPVTNATPETFFPVGEPTEE